MSHLPPKSGAKVLRTYGQTQAGSISLDVQHSPTPPSKNEDYIGTHAEKRKRKRKRTEQDCEEFNDAVSVAPMEGEHPEKRLRNEAWKDRKKRSQKNCAMRDVYDLGGLPSATAI
ncbi:hypothetical protein H0H92_002884, partial [Tricholoma furcatifolium]